MAKVILGNHTAVFAARSEQDRIRKFYCDVLGCKTSVTNDEVDRFQLDDVHFIFVYQDTALDEGGFQKAIYLELKTDNTEEMKRKILASGVKKLDLPDPHLYFQAPGGQVFRLVGMDEDLSIYEGSPSPKNPGHWLHSMDQLSDVLTAISHPTRRAIIGQLANGPARFLDVAKPFDTALNAVTKHLKVLERAGLIERRKQGREVFISFRGEPLRQAAQWMNEYERFWNQRLDQFQRHFKDKKEKAEKGK